MIAILAILVLIYVVWLFTVRNSEADLLYGFWKADASFLESSGLTNMIFFIDKNRLHKTDRNGYLLATNDEGMILNNPVLFKLSRAITMNPAMCDVAVYVVDIDWLEYDAPDHFASQQTLHYYPKLGKLVFSNAEEITAVLYRDNEMTDINYECPEKYKKEDDDIDGDAI
jgi:hypothetical protein